MNGLWKLLVAALGWLGFDTFLLSVDTVETSCLWIKESNFQSNFLMLKYHHLSVTLLLRINAHSRHFACLWRAERIG